MGDSAAYIEQNNDNIRYQKSVSSYFYTPPSFSQRSIFLGGYIGGILINTLYVWWWRVSHFSMLKLVIMLQVYFAIYDYFFLLSLAYMKKSLYLCSANPQWGSASGGAVVRSAANKSISADIFEYY